MGIIEFEAGVELRKLATVKTNQLVAVVVKDDKTIVRRIQFPIDLDAVDKLVADQFDVRAFPKACCLCSIRASDRRVVFTFGAADQRLGTASFYRLNESFTTIQATRGNIDMDATFGLTAPIVDILLTERSLCALDAQGGFQSYDQCTRQISKKVQLGDCSDTRNWVGGLLCFADELVLGRAGVEASSQLMTIDSMSSEDHRKLPTAVIGGASLKGSVSVGCMGDVLYVVDAGASAVYASKLSVTVRSEAFRIQRSGKGAKADRGCLERGGQTLTSDAPEHWLRVFFHVFEKFPVRSLLDSAMSPNTPCAVQVRLVFTEDDQDESFVGDAASMCKAYFNNLMRDLRQLNKPLAGLDLATNFSCHGSTEAHEGLEKVAVRRVLTSIISFVPVQICRAEDNMLKLLQDGEDNTKHASRSDNASESSDSATTEASEIAQSTRFGLLSPLLESWGGRCVVVTSMGKQSTGKSYFLNHLTGTTFAISGARCTDGAWMSLRFLSADTLLVVLDFEGLGSFEQEDIFLSVLNASVSLFTVFQERSAHQERPTTVSRAIVMSVKDVNLNDRRGVYSELRGKLNAIFKSSKEQNFLMEMYAGSLLVNCAPPFGTIEYYQNMEKDSAANLLKMVAPFETSAEGFVTGKAFLDCIRVVLAKISILDWTSMDKSTHSLLVTDARQKLPGILRTGCHVSQSLVADPAIPDHLKEDVMRVGAREKIVISVKEVFEAYPSFVTKWKPLDVVLDGIEDSEFDLGFDVTQLDGRKGGQIQKMMNALFRQFLGLQGADYGKSRLTTEHQSSFDAFLAFVLRRRKMKVASWLRSMLSDRLADVRSQLEQRYADPLLVYLSRCQHRCARCQLGCMHSVTHSSEVEHSCCTDHKCRGQCEYDGCREDLDSTHALPCSRSAGHEGKCECENGEHTCGQTCVLARASNCDRACTQRAAHPGDHLCSVQVHVCGATCSAETCNATCLLDIQREHSVHKCAEVQCLHSCLMTGCKNACGEKNHFHGQLYESRAFAEESGLSYASDRSEDIAHMCLGSHGCPAMCMVDGVCEQKVHLNKSARTYTGARGSFEYIFQEMNGCKKQCAQVLASGTRDHEGVQHSCIANSSSEAADTMCVDRLLCAGAADQVQSTIHYCDVRCPSCNYYCNKHFGHMGLHATSHGNMKQTYFLAKGNDIGVEERKYQVGERGIAEMCNLFCSKMGRGHIHYLPCEGNGRENCVYTADASQDHRRHCVDELYPASDRAMDELLHSQFWSTIGWEDPSSEDERALFAKCPFECNAPEHEESDQEPSYCQLEAWHLPAVKPAVDDGFAYVSGHKFECVYTVDSGKFHSIFVLDNSGSMSGQPWQDLLCACNEFVINRLNDGGENDIVSYITFDHRSRIHYEAEPLSRATNTALSYSGGGTSFEEGLRAANEVLSRNDYETYKVVLIFFSDGRPFDVELALALAQRIRSTYAKYDLKAFVVGFGHVNFSVLQRMANEMGGEYRQVLDANELQQEFQRIGAVLRTSEASLALIES